MAVYQFSALSNAQRISFDPASDVLNFDSTSVNASRIIAYDDGTGLRLVWQANGKYVVLTGMSPFEVTGSNITFANGTKLLFGDNSLSLNDNSANQLVGSSGADHLSGLGGNDTLLGLNGADWLEGGNGNDRLEGGYGNDTLSGGDDHDTLYGQAGADHMVGGAGDDVYGVDNFGDQIIEWEGGGRDLVLSSLDQYRLPAWVNDLTLTGAAAVGYGNELDNVITGHGGNNSLWGEGGNDRVVGNGGTDWLTGGAGRDTLVGGTGNDHYVIDEEDVIVELAGGGTDRVHADMNYTLPGNVEELSLSGPFNGYGNGLDNKLYGSDWRNFLFAGGGNDTLSGGIDSDTLNGGAGMDTFLFSVNPNEYNADSIGDFVSGTDRLVLLNGWPPEPGGFPGNHADYGAAGTLSADDPRFYAAAGARSGHDADDRLVYDTTAGRLYYDSDGAGGEAAQLIYRFAYAPQVAATDITIVDTFAF